MLQAFLCAGTAETKLADRWLHRHMSVQTVWPRWRDGRIGRHSANMPVQITYLNSVVMPDEEEESSSSEEEADSSEHDDDSTEQT